MSLEGQLLDQKSLRAVTGKTADWNEIAKDCIAFANASVDVLQIWLKRLLEWGLVESVGRTQATRYFVVPGLLRSLNFSGETTLKRIEPHRLVSPRWCWKTCSATPSPPSAIDELWCLADT